MAMILLLVVVSVIGSAALYAVLERTLWTSMATGILVVVLGQFLFGYHFPEPNSAGFWGFSVSFFFVGSSIAWGVSILMKKTQ